MSIPPFTGFLRRYKLLAKMKIEPYSESLLCKMITVSICLSLSYLQPIVSERKVTEEFIEIDFRNGASARGLCTLVPDVPTRNTLSVLNST